MSGFLHFVFSRFIHGVAGVRVSFLFKAEPYSTVWRDHILFFHSSANGHFGSCLPLVTVNNAVTMEVHVSVQIPVFISSGG